MTMDLQELTLSHKGQIEEAISETRVLQSSPLSMLAFAPHYIWRHHFKYLWTVKKGWTVIFAEYADGIYMPLPPLGPSQNEPSSETPGSHVEILRTVFDFMNEQNGGTAVSRIENVPEELKGEFQSTGCQLQQKDSDYLYRTDELIALKGEPYKSQRNAYNQCTRSQTPIFQPYSLSDRNACLALFDQWTEQKQQAVSSEQIEGSWMSNAMLEDARDAHEGVFTHAEDLGLLGRVVKIGERVCGYTFGYARNSQVFCVLLEVTDRTIIGLAQYLFREMCRECWRYSFINTMDDSGLPHLAHSKRGYHPCQMVSNYIATMEG